MRGGIIAQQEFFSQRILPFLSLSRGSPLSHPLFAPPSTFLRHLHLLGRFCRLRARRRAVCSSSPSVCRPPSVEDHVSANALVRGPAPTSYPSRAFSTPPLCAASPPRPIEFNAKILLSSPRLFELLPSFLPFFIRCSNKC